MNPSTKHRIFKVTSGKTLTLQDLTLKGGEAGKYDSSDPLASSGGAIRLNGGSASLLNVTISGCKAITTGSCTGQGGGIYAEDGGTLTMTSSTIKDCEATDSGGGIYATGGTINLTNCNLRGCKAIKGGGIRLYKSGGGDATLTVSGGEIGGAGAGEPNTASGTSGNGGGISVEGGSCTVTLKDGAKITGNTAINGGGVYMKDDGCSFTMESGTISNNTATDKGGGVTVYGGTFTMTDGIISGNTAVSGGGVYGVNFSSYHGTIIVKGPSEISGNTATAAGTLAGGGIYSGYKLTVGDSAQIKTNHASGAGGYGGGIATGEDSSFDFTGGTVSSNTANGNGKGKGIYVSYFNSSSAYMKMSGGAKVDSNNDVHLGSTSGNPAFITVTGALSNSPAATLTMDNSAAGYAVGRKVVKGDRYTLTAADVARFPITAQQTSARTKLDDGTRRQRAQVEDERGRNGYADKRL